MMRCDRADNPAPRRAAVRPAVVLGTLLLATLTSCSDAPSPAVASSTGATAAVGTSVGGAAPSGTTAAAPADGASAPVADAPPAIKTVEFVTAGGGEPASYRLEITALSRRGPFAVLEGRLTCTKGPSDHCDGEFVLSEGSSTLNTPAGITLIDPVGKKEYLVVRDSEERPYASKLQPSMPVDMAYPFYVNFPVLAHGATSVTIVLPGGGQPQIADVPVG